MTFQEYTDQAMYYKNKSLNRVEAVTEGIIGLNSESGECADIVKKYLFQGHPKNTKHFAEELGDVMWYLALCADAIGYDLETVCKLNIQKLKRRYPNGFEYEKSINRQCTEVE